MLEVEGKMREVNIYRSQGSSFEFFPQEERRGGRFDREETLTFSGCWEPCQQPERKGEGDPFASGLLIFSE